ncbi:unnamed protein product [Colias eurytheme]|nr:unnamed protein product [Colias eurytheme]
MNISTIGSTVHDISQWLLYRDTPFCIGGCDNWNRENCGVDIVAQFVILKDTLTESVLQLYASPSNRLSLLQAKTILMT